MAQLPGRLLIVQSQATVPGRRLLTAQPKAARGETRRWGALRFPKLECGLSSLSLLRRVAAQLDTAETVPRFLHRVAD